MSKNLFETYKVNGRTYTDNLGINAMISIPKKQYIEYEQQNDENKRLNNIINKLEKYIKTDAKIELYKDVSGFRTFVDGQDLLNKLQELKGSDKVE